MARVTYMLVCIVTATLCGACATRTDLPAATDVDAILAQAMDEDAYGEARQCLSTTQYSEVRVVDDRRLMFRRSDRAWLNQMPTACPGLRIGDVLLFEMHGNRLCAMDAVTVVDRFLFWRRTGPRCTLGSFEPITPDRADAIEAIVRGG